MLSQAARSPSPRKAAPKIIKNSCLLAFYRCHRSVAPVRMVVVPGVEAVAAAVAAGVAEAAAFFCARLLV